MQVNEKAIEKLKDEIFKLEMKLHNKRARLDKLTPHIPLYTKKTKYDNKKKMLVHRYEFWCSYCGEPIYRPQNKDVTRHKCGQMILWKHEKIS